MARYVHAKIQLKAYNHKRAFLESTSSHWQKAADDLVVLEQAITESDLTPLQMYVVAKYCFEDWLQEEIAYELNVSQQDVSVTLAFAISKIQRIFKRWERLERSQYIK